MWTAFVVFLRRVLFGPKDYLTMVYDRRVAYNAGYRIRLVTHRKPYTKYVKGHYLCYWKGQSIPNAMFESQRAAWSFCVRHHRTNLEIYGKK